jgi:putative lipoprotein
MEGSTKMRVLAIVMLSIVLVLLGCGASSPSATQSAAVTGTVTYREKIALPADAVINIKLIDASRADAPAVTISEQNIITGGKQVPFPFELKYDPSRIDTRMSYSVRAVITQDGRLLFTTDTTYRVITGGNPVSVELVLKKV